MKIILCLFWWLITALAYGNPHAKVFELVPLAGKNPVDPSLKTWLKRYEDAAQWRQLSRSQLQAWSKNQPLVAQQIIRLQKAEKAKRSLDSERQKVLKAYLAEPAKYQEELLLPYLLESLLEAKGLSDSQKSRLSQDIVKYGKASCAEQDLILDEIAHSDEGLTNHKRASYLLERIQAFHSPEFHKEALEEFLEALDDKHQQRFRPKLQGILKSYPKLTEDHDWVFPKPVKEPYLARIEATLDKSKSAAGRKRCNTAKKMLNLALKQDSKAKHFPLLQKATERVDRCYRSKGTQARIRYWIQVRKVLEQRYGFQGWAHASAKEGAIRWGRDEFPEAIAIYQQLYKKAQKEKDSQLEATSLHTLARIAENEAKVQEAYKLFKSFVDKFPNHAKTDHALKALVLLAVERKKTEDARHYLERILQTQNRKPIADQSASMLSFALFWSGRIAAEAKRFEHARIYWRRGASEYYSTFYGALSHYMFEKLAKTSLRLQPHHNQVFNFASLRSSFDSGQKQSIDRAMALLSIGLQEEATCEIKELHSKSHKPEQLFALSLMQHLSGEWLRSIQTFSQIPRTLRHKLPLGSERILFPRAFTQVVGKFSNKLSLDADLIYAIIRQESVFNPRAISPVGARGLMQLMPATARLEARHLTYGYVSQSKRRQIRRQIKHRNRLLNAEMNIVLGVHHVSRLMKKYNHPIYVLTAYNASPRATERWQKNLAASDKLEFIEKIPYKETRNYVKLVLRNYFYYKRWYAGSDPNLPYIDAILPPSLRNIEALSKGQKGKSLKSEQKAKG